jgi:NADH:ubiquinone oxidoreductase subunit F (NADH-binding)
MRGLDADYRLSLGAHRAIHGDQRELSRHELVNLTEGVNLLGRGGAGFPVARKLRALPRRGARAVIVNGTEGEPASAKDRLLMRRTPHQVLDGVVTVVAALKARDVMIAVHDPESEQSLHAAIAERRDCRRVKVVRSLGGFVSGEASAVIRGAEGARAVPAGRRVLPTERGFAGAPTFLSNVETFAQLALIARWGSAYADTGLHEEPGTTLLTLGGAVARPGVVEVPLGVPLQLLGDAAGIVPGSAILLGGYHGTFVPDPRGVTLSHRDLKRRGLTLGAGVVLALSPATCPIAEVEAVMSYLAGESAGQCGPCVFGLPAMSDDLAQLRLGNASGRMNLQRHLEVLPGRGACAHPTGAARFLSSALSTFAEDVAHHLDRGDCGRPHLCELPLPSTRSTLR